MHRWNEGRRNPFYGQYFSQRIITEMLDDQGFMDAAALKESQERLEDDLQNSSVLFCFWEYWRTVIYNDLFLMLLFYVRF